MPGECNGIMESNMKYKIAICDDDVSQRGYLFGLVRGWAHKTNQLTEVRQYGTAESFLFDYEGERDFDILLLDVEMPGINGIELARTLRRSNLTIQIIFITGFYEYFSDGFDVSALHYLIKPVKEEKLFPVLDKAVENLNCRQRSVLLSTAEGSVKVVLSDILYVEAENVHVKVCTVSGEVFRPRISLGRFSEQLDETFFKVHRSFVVNLKYIQRISRSEIVMVNDDRIPLSRGMYDAVHTALIKYL